MNGLRQLCARLAAAPAFNCLIIAMILITALGLGLETSQSFHARYHDMIEWAYQVALAIFVLEAAIKLTAVAPRFERYFKDGWNLFDFVILVLALMPEAGEFALIARLARLLRVLRVVTVVPQLRLIVSTWFAPCPASRTWGCCCLRSSTSTRSPAYTSSATTTRPTGATSASRSSRSSA